MIDIHLPPRICARPDEVLQREWLVTNGIGGFAAGTVAGALTRRYHGLLIAALHPPVGRRLLAAKLDEVLSVDGREWPLYTNVWASGVEPTNGLSQLRQFDLRDGVPTWTYAAGGARLIKRIWMEPGCNCTYVQYELGPQSPAAVCRVRLFVNDRDYHYLSHGQPSFQVQAQPAGLDIRTPESQSDLRVRWADAPDANWTVDYNWYHGFALPVEAARGFDHSEDHLCVGVCELALRPGAPATLSLAVDAAPSGSAADAMQRRVQHTARLLDAWTAAEPRRAARATTPVRQLVLAADQFIVRRPAPGAPDGHTIIAGYPWFTDWGRDTMIALPGLTLATGRPEIARQVLLTWAEYLCDGLIPNRFPDAGGAPEYHTADATLWYLWAIDQYVRATHDIDALARLFPVMVDVVAGYQRGTRHNIRVGADGLVEANDPALNLTWMDAKIGDRVITPRAGKPVELSALWYDALANMGRLAELLDRDGSAYVRLAATTRKSFQRFWNVHTRCCYDVLDGRQGHDPAIRPNQIFAVSLTHSPLTEEQQQAVVQTCGQHLHTWFGLRSLAPDAPGYRGHYHGGPVERDEAYHQGTTWGWLLGPYVLAQYKRNHDAAAAHALLEPMLGQLWSSGMGTLSEVFDAEAPHRADGCFAQAWSVAETLRAWCVTQGQ
jgi:predicted glycogen debranching enzyme